ncbi:expressed protein [Arabidopsis lyrata subsp. lyrata]|uniref:Expressed protein n=1 Tax=Arabidopsis lyrata subsp. lyrata TaxID=81972 RepID=D7MWU5_ARALL|nr:expressed protein [Arabidopsis lyrata subsp. lyrata]
MAAPNPPPHIGPIGPLRRPGWYNLQTIHENHGTLDGVRYTESTNFVNEAYRRRVHRRSQLHGTLAVVHYRIV